MTDPETRLVVFGLVGSTAHNGKELLSRLLNADLFSEPLGNAESHLKVHGMWGPSLVAYEDHDRSLMYVHLPFEREDGRRWGKNEWILQLSCVFAVSHIVLLLSPQTQIEIEVLYQIRALQAEAFKDGWLPFIKKRFPVDSRGGLRPELQKIRSVMLPGYCEPQLLFLFQVEILPGDILEALGRRAHTLSDQLTQLFQKCEVPSRQASDPVVNKSAVKCMLLPPFPVTPEAHLKQWAAFLDDSPEEDTILDEALIRKFKDLVYSRKERMQHMLQSSSDDVFPVASHVKSVFSYIEKCMRESLIAAQTDPSEGGDSCLGDLVSVWESYVYGVNAIDRLTKDQCRKAMQSSLHHYQRSVPELYTEPTHKAALREIVKRFDVIACGSAQEKYRTELISQCLSYWERGHRQCEAISLTGRSCINSVEPESSSGQCLQHESGFEFWSARHAGTCVTKRADPFSFVDANCLYYASGSREARDRPGTAPPSGSTRSRQRASGSSKSSRSAAQTSQQPSVKTTKLDMTIHIIMEGSAKSARKESSTVVHAWCSWTVLGSRDDYTEEHGLDQPGFLANKNQLFGLNLHLPIHRPSVHHSAEFDESFPPLQSTVQPAKKMEPVWNSLQDQLPTVQAVRRELKKYWPEILHPMKEWPLSNDPPSASTSYTRKPLHRPLHATGSLMQSQLCQPRDALEDVLIGLEYESLYGVRYIAAPKYLSKGPNRDSFSVFVKQDISLFLPSPGKKSEGDPSSGIKPGKLCQLQRIFFVTPSAPATFATQICVTFKSPAQQDRPAVTSHFRLSTPIELPPGSFCVLRLPFAYGIPSDATAQRGIMGLIDERRTQAECWMPFLQTAPEHPYDAYIQKQSLLFPC